MAASHQGKVVFLCHAGESKPFVRQLVDRLETDGLKKDQIFFDERSLETGDELDSIIKVIESPSLKLFVFVVSKYCFDSDRTWIRAEWEAALANNKQIFPIWLDDNNDDFKAFGNLVRKFSYKLRKVIAQRVNPQEISTSLSGLSENICSFVYAEQPTQQRPPPSTNVGLSSARPNFMPDVLPAKLKLEFVQKSYNQLLDKAEALYDDDTLKDEERLQEADKIFHRFKARIESIIPKGCFIFNLRFLQPCDVDEFYHDHFRLGPGSLSAALTDVLITDQMRTAALGEELMVRVEVRYDDYIRVRRQLCMTGVLKSTSVDNLSILVRPRPERSFRGSKQEGLDLAITSAQDTGFTDWVAHPGTRHLANCLKRKSKQVAALERGLEIQGNIVRSLHREVTLLNKKDEEACSILMSRTEEIQQLQESNKSMEATIEALMAAKTKVAIPTPEEDNAPRGDDVGAPEKLGTPLSGVEVGEPEEQDIPPRGAEGKAVFLCHAGENKTFVRQLVDRLETDGLKKDQIFYDEISLQPGDELDSIIKVIESPSLKLFVFVVSKYCFDNDRTWIRAEWEAALENNKQILPIWLDDNNDGFKAFGNLVREFSYKLRKVIAQRVNPQEISASLPGLSEKICSLVLGDQPAQWWPIPSTDVGLSSARPNLTPGESRKIIPHFRSIGAPEELDTSLRGAEGIVTELRSYPAHELDIEVVYYKAGKVFQLHVTNKSGCRLWFGDRNQPNLRQNVDPNLSPYLYGPADAEQILLPPRQPTGRRKDDKVVKGLLNNMERGLVLTTEGGNVYATRLCKTKVFWKSNDNRNQQAKRMEREQRVSVFDYENYLRELSAYGNNEGPKPMSEIIFSLGKSWSDEVPLENTPIYVIVRSRTAHNLMMAVDKGAFDHDAQNALHSTDDMASDSDEFDKLATDLKEYVKVNDL